MRTTIGRIKHGSFEWLWYPRDFPFVTMSWFGIDIHKTWGSLISRWKEGWRGTTTLVSYLWGQPVTVGSESFVDFNSQTKYPLKSLAYGRKQRLWTRHVPIPCLTRNITLVPRTITLTDFTPSPTSSRLTVLTGDGKDNGEYTGGIIMTELYPSFPTGFFLPLPEVVGRLPRRQGSVYDNISPIGIQCMFILIPDRRVV